MQSIQQRLEETEERYQRREALREKREWHLENLGKGGDWREIDSPARVLRYARERGLGEEAELALEATVRAAPAPEERAVVPAAAAPPELDVLERIIGEDDLLAARFLDHGAAVAQSVGRIVLRSEFGTVLGYGTGFLVSAGVLMTNNHVFETASAAQHSVVQFDYRELPDGRTSEPTVFALRPDLLFETNKDLDVTVLSLASASASGEAQGQRGWCPLKGPTGKAIVNSRVNIVQHPAGNPLQLALRDNRIVDVFEDFLHYKSDTKRGSSGAPVFNDQWQLAALHHSGVPEKDDAGYILLVNGDRWDSSDAQMPMISWVANEGVRISSIVAYLKDVAGRRTGTARQLLDGVLAAQTPPPDGESTPKSPFDEGRGSGPRVGPDGRVHWTIPLDVSASLGIGAPAPVITPSAPPQGPISSPERPEVDPKAMQRALNRLKETESWTYCDEAEDATARDDYYAEIEEDLTKAQLYDALHELLADTHTTALSYSSARLDHLYPWIDLREDPRELRSIYSGENFSPEEVIRRELEVEAFRARRIREFRVREASFDEEAFEAFLDDLEAQSPFNCEHVVPQSWFNKKQPMKADLHHLFTCESDCNSFRSNIPYYEFDPEDEKVREKCGERVADKFEPAAGKGAVARATLYFLLRYPNKVGDTASELQADRLATLLAWHEAEAPDTWEKHRNAEIAKIQGNRNPLIDFPEWGRAIDFRRGFA